MNSTLTPPSNVLLPIAYWRCANRQPTDNRVSPTGTISALSPNAVFVFGSNESGFHGAGAAAFAYTGEAGNQYKRFNPMLKKPNGTVGKWAILGQAKGFQIGTTGRSYAICTVKQPGAKRSITILQIQEQVIALYEFAKQNPHMLFLVPKSGSTGTPSLNGYTLEENASCYLSTTLQ